jgi:tetratricopeptide (TPR) repeat protein
MRGWAQVAGPVLLLAVSALAVHSQSSDSQSTNSRHRGETQLAKNSALDQRVEKRAVPGSEACAGCHSEIYKSYAKTVMATASGDAADGLIAGDFVHKRSGVRYRVYEQDTHAWMSYERVKDERAGVTAGSEVHGQRELSYFIGSGKKGRSYLFSQQDFLFETPINWYAQEGRWNMTPAYTEAREIPMNLPAYVDCLNCHTSGMQPPAAGTDNKFPDKPFLHGGITCQRCHGSGEDHIAKRGSTADSSRGDSVAGSPLANPTIAKSLTANSSIVNPAKLSPDRRDAVCMECHFEGTAAVEQPGKHLYQFQPGDRLTDYIHYFLRSEDRAEKAQALSQFEALSLSQCQRKSGDKMWCGSCHDPHAEPSASEKAEFYRGKCLACHGEAFAAKHHADKRDCTSCHMPALPSKDVAHTEATDHRILRNPTGELLLDAQQPGLPSQPRLVSFPARAATLATTRDFALAWETLAQRGVPGAAHEAEQNLRKAVNGSPDDAVLLAALAFVEQEHGHEKEARELYEHALKIDPLDNDAATNLGTLEAQAGNLQLAVALWKQAFERVPYRSAIGMNLAMALCAAGQKEEARLYVQRVLDFDPDLERAKRLAENMEKNSAQCKSD